MTLSQASGRRWTAVALVSALALALSACAPQAPAQPRAAPTASVPACVEEWCPVLHEDFDQDAPIGAFQRVYGHNLSGYPDGHGDTSGNGQYWPSKVLSTHDGVLDWFVHSEGGQPMSAAPLPQGYEGQRYGRWTIRFRSDLLPQSKMAMLLWPDSDQWSDGEIDFPEGELGQDIYGYSHNVEGKPSHNQFKFDTKTTMTGWHTASIEWMPDHITFTLDGKSKTTNDPKALPSGNFHQVLQVETSLDGPAPDASVEGHVQVDWIQIERYNPQGG